MMDDHFLPGSQQRRRSNEDDREMISISVQAQDFVDDDEILFHKVAEHDEKTDEQVAERDLSEPERGDGTCSSDDSPEAMIRQDNKFISLFRGFLVAFLLAATVATVTLVYRYLSGKEKEKFLAEYHLISDSLASSMFLDMRLMFWMAHTISKSITLANLMHDSPVTNFTIPSDLWDGITLESRWIAEHLVVSWIPFLYSDEERVAFEAHARDTSLLEIHGSPENPSCHVCGGHPNMRVGSGSSIIDLGNSKFTCEDVYTAGEQGLIPAEFCPFVQRRVKTNCDCMDSPDRWSYDNGTSIRERTVQDGLFRFLDEDDVVAVDEEFGKAPYGRWLLVIFDGPSFTTLNFAPTVPHFETHSQLRCMDLVLPLSIAVQHCTMS
jgi:hypothetical protein